MKFIVSSTLLLSHLQTIARIINVKNTLPILDNFLFEIEDNTLTAKASDLETTLITQLEIENSNMGNGSIAVPAKLLTTTLREFPEQPLTFDIDLSNLKIIIYSDKGEYSLMGFKADEFPEIIEKESDAISLEINTEVLNQSINKTIFATADDELRPIMNGILIEIQENECRFVASDAHKLVQYKRLDLNFQKNISFILPKKPANILRNITEKRQEIMNIEVDAKNAFFFLRDYTLICRLLEGKYPNYQAVIPKDNSNHMVIDREEFANTVKRVAAFSNPASNLIKFQLSKNKLLVSAQDIDFSISAYETLPCKYTGDEFEIGFKSVFLSEIISNLSAENVIIKLADSTRAGLFQPFEQEESKEEEIIMLLMPMMLNV